jgi:CHAT domain-containing protein
LSRAFMAAGARGVVASLWAVSDVSTAELMERFYDALFSGKTPACEALRKARASLLDDPKFSHPFFWSPFIVIGTERTPW